MVNPREAGPGRPLVRRVVGDNCALSEASHSQFETGLESRVVSPIRWFVTILFGVVP